MIDEKGRCCGKKPREYKRPAHHLFCTRCLREYQFDSKEQVANFFWIHRNGEFVEKRIELAKF